MTTYEQWDLALSAARTFAVALGFVLTCWQLARMNRDAQNTIELASRQNAMEIIARYSEPPFVERRIKLRGDEALQKNFYESAYLLNFFEELAVAIKHKTADETLLEDYFVTILREWLEQPYVVTALTKAKRQDPAVFENVVALYRAWEQKRDSKLSIDSVPELK